jgi:hypothetical protein
MAQRLGMAKMTELTAKYVRSILDYDTETGVLTWKYNPNKPLNWNARYSGKRAGRVTNMGYIRLSINNREYMAHRIIWLINKGCIGDNEIDHINGVKSDNRLCNLRLATRQQNEWNRPGHKNVSSKHKGVFWVARDKRWRAEIVYNGKTQYIGQYECEELASLVYSEHADKLYGEYSYAGGK